VPIRLNLRLISQHHRERMIVPATLINCFDTLQRDFRNATGFIEVPR
jgi:hypothetical protein